MSTVFSLFSLWPSNKKRDLKFFYCMSQGNVSYSCCLSNSKLRLFVPITEMKDAMRTNIYAGHIQYSCSHAHRIFSNSYFFMASCIMLIACLVILSFKSILFATLVIHFIGSSIGVFMSSSVSKTR